MCGFLLLFSFTEISKWAFMRERTLLENWIFRQPSCILRVEGKGKLEVFLTFYFVIDRNSFNFRKGYESMKNLPLNSEKCSGIYG